MGGPLGSLRASEGGKSSMRSNPLVALIEAVFVGVVGFLLALTLSALLARTYTSTLDGLITWFSVGAACSVGLSVFAFVLTLNRLNSK
jgi:hypothetical protein